jgi:hypothetical protein
VTPDTLVDSSQVSRVELELRLLPGVLSVAADVDETGGIASVSVVAVNPAPDLADEVASVTSRWGVDVGAAVTVLDFEDVFRPRGPAGPPPLDGRVALVEAVYDDDLGTTRVRLAYGGREGVGRSANGPLVGGAEATLDALADLGVSVPCYLFSVGRSGGGPRTPVVVLLRPRHGGANSPGVARGDVDVEAASRATLSAVNRLLRL